MAGFDGACPTCGQEYRGWIDASLVLPEEGRWVIIATADGIIDTASYEPKGNYWFYGYGEERFLITRTVTHWQPLPTLPVQE